MNKRAQFFTIIAVVLIFLMFASLDVYSSIRERQSIKQRVSTMDSFLRSIETNLQRQVYTSGFRIIFLAEVEITNKEMYIPDIDNFFNESFFNGSVNGVPQDNGSGIMNGATYNAIVNSININSEKISVNITMENPRINITQEDPWNVKFTLTTDFVMRDKQNLALWNKTQNISAFISILKFEDPIYKIEGKRFTIIPGYTVNNNITKTIYEGNYVGCPGSDYSNLIIHATNMWYTNNTDAPSFLKRLEGDFSADPNGIESFVNTDALHLNNPLSGSIVDHQYFGTGAMTMLVPGMPTWFKIAPGHFTRYQIPFTGVC